MATNYVTAGYQEIYDMSTQASKVSVIGVRTPSMYRPYSLLNGFFRQFRKYKYLGCTIKVQPASMLPADPLQLGLEAGETLDPRDILNPILVKGCHGNDLGAILQNVYRSTNSADVPDASVQEFTFDADASFPIDGPAGAFSVDPERMYYSCLTDKSWKKYGLQQPFGMNLYPLVHGLAMDHPFNQLEIRGFEGSSADSNGTRSDMGQLLADPNVETSDLFDIVGHVQMITTGSGQSPIPRHMFTNKLYRLSWLDTMYTDRTSSTSKNYTYIPSLPKLFMSVMILPPSYRQEMYMRIIINHRFAFKDFTTSMNNTFSDAYFDNLPDSATASAASIEPLNADDTSIIQAVDGVY